MDLYSLWTVPEPLSTCNVRLDETTVITIRRHGNAQGPRLIVSHGNGLAVDLYYPFWSLLAEDFDLFVYDLRNHGWNGVGAWQEHNVPTMIRDQGLILDAIDRNYGAKKKVGIFHSVSAMIALLSLSSSLKSLVSLESDSLFSALVLFDPPLCKPGVNEMEFDAATERLAARCRRREYRFSTQEDFVDLVTYLPGFAFLLPGVPHLFAKTTLRRSTEGTGFELRCPREFEAQIFDYARTFSVMIDLGSLSCPTKVIGSDPTIHGTYIPSLDFTKILTVDYDFVPDTTHLLQLENPQKCIEKVYAFLNEINFI